MDEARYRLRRAISALAACGWMACAWVSPAAAQLRIVTYNTTGAPRQGMDFILKSIGQELKAGVVKPIDVLLLQEQSTAANLPNTQAFVSLLNSIYAGQGITYARSTTSGASLGDTTQTLVYKTQTVTLLQEMAFGAVDQPRKTLRYKLKPAGYDDSAAFYIYNSHYKASEGTANASLRLAEATAIRSNADGLNDPNIRAIYAGDHNFYRATQASEPAVPMLMSAGNGQAFDPVNQVGTWHNSLSYATWHTQSPTTFVRDPVNYGGQVIGGLDDRFDFLWITDAMRAHNNQSEGFSYIADSYRTFGNNGTTFNADIDSGTNTYPFDFVSFDATNTRSQLLTNLASVTDHLPVVADFRIPAKMSVEVAAIPSTVNLGASVAISVSIENIAPVASGLFADELDYTLSVTGDLFGGVTDLTPAASGPDFNDIFLNTATPGLKSGVITVMATSPQASNAFFSMPVSYQVIAPFLEADFNNDGEVNGVDLSTWSTNFGLASGAVKNQGDADLDGDVDGGDWLVWQRQRGSLPAGLVAGALVPEPGAGVMALVGLAALGRRRRRRGPGVPCPA